MAGPGPNVVDRRRLLLGAAAAPALGALAGCGLRGNSQDPDALMVERAIDAEAGLVAAYDRLIPALPRRGAELTAFRDHHRQHRAALARLLSQRRQLATAPVTPTQPVGLPTLVVMERAAAAGRAADATVAPERLAALLGSISASEAVHADLLVAG